MALDTEIAEAAQRTTADDRPAREALEELIEFKKERIHGDMTPCPSCTILVPIDSRRCTHCGSDIAANNALVRETLRHIQEITARLDEEHRLHTSLRGRIKRLFGAHPAPEPDVTDPNVERVFENLAPGDHLTVREVDGAWIRVEAANGRRGWVYRTPVGRP